MDTLEEACWKIQDLAARRKGDPLKVRLALRLRSETTGTLAWIAAPLHMGTPSPWPVC